MALDAYIQEISVILESMTAETKLYARYRAIGEGFSRNVDWLNDSAPYTISFFNALTEMLNSTLVMSIWKITEPLAANTRTGRYEPGQLFSSDDSSKRRAHDEIRSLPRLAYLFRRAFGNSEDDYLTRYLERQDEIVTKYLLPPRDQIEFKHKSAKDRILLLQYCDEIDIIVQSDARASLDRIRNEGFAHSSAISRKTIAANIDEGGLRRSELFSLGDRVMQLAQDFEAVWYQRATPHIRDLIDNQVQTGELFWQGARTGLSSFR